MGFLLEMDLPRDTGPPETQFMWKRKTSNLWLIYTILIPALGLPKCKYNLGDKKTMIQQKNT